MTIIGDVGSGKSSLMNAIIGDMLFFDLQEAENIERQENDWKSKVLAAQGQIEKKKGKRKGVVSLS